MQFPSGKKFTVETLAEIYGDQAVAQAVFDSAEQNKTSSRIESRDLTIPDLQDAFAFFHRQELDKIGMDAETRELLMAKPNLHAAFIGMERRVSALEQPHSTRRHKKEGDE